MLFPGVSDNPNKVFRFNAGRIGKYLSKMRVIGQFELILYDNFSACCLFFGENISRELPHDGFGLNQRDVNTDLIAELIKILV